MHPKEKVHSHLFSLSLACQKRREIGQKIVLTSGCLDLLHVDHLEYLIAAKNLAPSGCLVVGINSDAFVKRLKGEGRPVNAEANRALMIAGFFMVDLVVVFDDDLSLIAAVAPDIYLASTTSRVRVYDDRPRVALLNNLRTEIVEIGSEKPDSTTAMIARVAGGK